MATDQIKITFFSNDFWNSHDPDDQGNRASRVQVAKVSGGPMNFQAYVYRCLLVEDNDGAPTCYAWDNPEGQVSPPWPKGANPQRGLTPLERGGGQAVGLANASSDANLWKAPFYWAGLFAATRGVADATGLRIDTRPALASTLPEPPPSDGLIGKFPVVKDDGFYVSTTGQPADAGANLWEQRRYFDAAATPYAVWAALWGGANSGVNLGDRGLAINNNTGTSSEFAFLDTGTPNHVGESSRKLCRTLVPCPDSYIYVPNTDHVSFIVFPGSRSGAGVRGELEKLSAAENCDELPLFLSLGADLARFQAWLRRIERHESTEDSWNEYMNIRLALMSKGYQPARDGGGIIYRLAEHSINAG